MRKADLYAIVERAHAEGIGARVLAALTGYSTWSMRQMARALGLPPLTAETRRCQNQKRPAQPSAELLAMIACAVETKVVARPFRGP